eukprot:g23120.t1
MAARTSALRSLARACGAVRRIHSSRVLADQAKIRAPIADALKVRQPQAMSVPKDMAQFDDADMAILHNLGIETDAVIHNARPGTLYDEALRYEKGSAILSTGALAAYSGAKTGRSPMDKRVVEEPEHGLGKDELEIRVITSRAYHALFMHNMLIRPTEEELANFGEPDYTIYNAGAFPANRATDGMTSGTSVSLNFKAKEVVILGSQYAGEMKKGVFTIMNYLLPKQGILSMHASANEGQDGDVTVFFGLSGTGKTTLSADENRKLIGDDEHAWTDKGVFNIEGGCYAKAIGLTREKEPEIWDAIRFGALLENVVFDTRTGEVDYDDNSITENTRVSYPLEYIPNVKIPAVGGHPKNIIMLTCDAFGVLPPVSKLTPAQAMYHFISGYTAKVAGTEMGVSEPTATFSACFGAPFMAEYENFPRFNLKVPKSCPNVDSQILMPNKTWTDQTEFERMSTKLSALFKDNFEKFKDGCSEDIKAAAPEVGRDGLFNNALRPWKGVRASKHLAKRKTARQMMMPSVARAGTERGAAVQGPLSDDSTVLVVARTPDASTEVIGGQFELVQRIGRGGVASMHQGKCLRTGRLVAIKTIFKDCFSVSPHLVLDSNGCLLSPGKHGRSKSCFE